jgi:hypothetical protein
LARLGELTALVLDFVEQAHIFDGNHCLISERGYQLNLFTLLHLVDIKCFNRCLVP